VGKKASQAGHECMPSESILRSEHTLEEEADERERLEVCERLSSLSTIPSSISSNFRLNDVESEISWGDCSRHSSIRFILPEKVSGCDEDEVLGDKDTSISSSGTSEEQYDEQTDSSSPCISPSSSPSSSWSSSKDDDVEEV